MSDTPRSFAELAPPSKAPQVAWEYADHVWLETLFKQRKKLLGEAVDNIISNIESEIADKATGDSEITDQDIAEYNTWKTDIEQERAGWDSRLLVLEQAHERLQAAHLEPRLEQRRARLEPSYIIDPTEPEWRLKIQREFAVEREARMIAMFKTKREEWDAYKATPKGRYYVTSEVPSLAPSVSLKAECQAITNYLEETFGKRMDEYEAAYQDTPWLPENIARRGWSRRRNGRYADDINWWKVQRDMGYWLPEVVLLSVVTEVEVEDVKFYDGNAVNGQPRRLTRPERLLNQEDVEDDGDEAEGGMEDERQPMDELKSQDENKEEHETQTEQPEEMDNTGDAPQSSNQQALSTAQTEQ
ncbi:hypothetical protein L207DRAFT_641980 [Hyaloscypha variabilis F]|uniref:Uncharacterized protein n=1 Tax=Hyaloscypha variabilis (strain UAMH 11265 / GT02V1 / F) TaxID=1149755 RepID=A0A2J6QV60_HYAVF|nr:hypothetical protein L207DRAFT_641980 [Hyaloscypha variabilis F]